jgi:hypothetical protein
MIANVTRSVVFAGLALVVMTACQIMRIPELQTISAGHTGCTPEQITISNRHADTFGGGVTWNATCNDKVYLCSGIFSQGNYSCAPVAK